MQWKLSSFRLHWNPHCTMSPGSNSCSIGDEQKRSVGPTVSPQGGTTSPVSAALHVIQLQLHCDIHCTNGAWQMFKPHANVRDLHTQPMMPGGTRQPAAIMQCIAQRTPVRDAGSGVANAQLLTYRPVPYRSRSAKWNQSGRPWGSNTASHVNGLTK